MNHSLDILFLSLDGFAAGSLIGLSRWRGRRLPLALSFGICDAFGAMAGGALLALLAVAVIGYASSRGWRSVLPYAIPVLLGLDSVVFPVPVTDAAGLAAASAVLAYGGLTAGSMVASRRLRPAWTLGLAAMSCLLFLV